MSLIRRAALTASAGLLALLPPSPGGIGVGHAAEPLALTCSTETPTVPLGGTVILRAWAQSPSGRALGYTWAATGGRIEDRGAEARWSLAELRTGTFAATVKAGDGESTSSECRMRVTVRRDVQGRGSSRETGGAFLAAGRSEAAGYGLYSYLLLGAPPSESSRERCLKAIEAYLSLVPDVMSLEEYVPRRELNIFYLPVRGEPVKPLSGQWVLDNYDYARARSLLRALPGPNRDGPYILAAFRPLGSAAAGAPSGPISFRTSRASHLIWPPRGSESF
jgi:hypothetical protein